jgi:hypothetical protein
MSGDHVSLKRQLRHQLQAGRPAIQHQVKSPPPKRRTAAQIAQARMGWKLRLQNTPKNVSAPQQSKNEPKMAYAKRAIASSSANEVGSARSSGLFAASPIRTPAKRFVSYDAASAAAIPSKNIETAVQVASSVAVAYKAHTEATFAAHKAKEVNEKLSPHKPFDTASAVYGNSLQALPSTDPSFNEIISMLHLAMPQGYERPKGAVIRAVANQRGTLDFLQHSAGRPTENCWVDARELRNQNSVEKIHQRGGKIRAIEKDSGLLFASGTFPQYDHSWDGIVSVLLCKVSVGRPYWIPRNQAGDIASKYFDDKAYYPGNLSSAYDSICFMPSERSDGGACRFLVANEMQALACWYVTFVPRKVEVVQPETNETTKALSPEAKMRVSLWEKRFKRMKREKDVVAMKRSQDDSDGSQQRLPSQNAPEKRKHASMAYQRMMIDSDFVQGRLEMNLRNLHDRLEMVHDNYVETEEEVNDRLHAALEQIENSKTARKLALLAWKRQLEEYLCHIKLVDRLQNTTVTELTSKQLAAYNGVFKNAMENFCPKPGGWHVALNPGKYMNRLINATVDQKVCAGHISKNMGDDTISPTYDGDMSPFSDKGSPYREEKNDRPSVLPPTNVLNHVMDFRKQWEDPTARQSRLTSLNERMIKRLEPKPQPAPLKETKGQPVTPTSTNTIYMKGWMLKRDPVDPSAGWKRRYFVLSSHKLTWQDDEYSEATLGSMWLEACEVRLRVVNDRASGGTNQTDFFVDSPKRTVLLRANSDAYNNKTELYRRKDWVSGLQKNTHVARAALRQKRGLFASFNNHDAFSNMDSIFRDPRYTFIDVLATGAQETDSEMVADLVFGVFSSHGSMELAKMLSSCVLSDSLRGDQNNDGNYFQQQALLPALIDRFFQAEMEPLLQMYLLPLINIVNTKPLSYNLGGLNDVSGSLLTEEELEDNARNFLHLCLSFCRAISLIFEGCSKGMQHFISTASKHLDGTRPWTIGRAITVSICGALMRVPELIPVKEYGVDYLKPNSTEVLRMVSVTFQYLVEGRLISGSKRNVHIMPANKFLQNNFGQLGEWKKEMMKKYKDAGGHEPTEPGVHEASMTDTKIESLISSLHQFMRFAYEKGRGYWENIPLADHVSFDRNELIDTVFEKFGESGSRNNVRKTYGNTVVSNNEFSQ